MAEEGTEQDRTRRQLPTARLEASSDGIFTIAGTLLVIEIAVPPGSTHLWHAIVEQWPSYLGHLVSFVTIGAIWLAHGRREATREPAPARRRSRTARPATRAGRASGPVGHGTNRGSEATR
ncbi:TMEM175 family protein [Streptomyces sp. NPDC006458]|uniref:TMEM175 family protein n=1 Tax=Streptomyces sp. NPDC006458 TaxID=3154302 RepID=UPI0033A21A86